MLRKHQPGISQHLSQNVILFNSSHHFSENLDENLKNYNGWHIAYKGI